MNDDRCVIDRLPHTYHFYKKIQDRFGNIEVL